MGPGNLTGFITLQFSPLVFLRVFLMLVSRVRFEIPTWWYLSTKLHGVTLLKAVIVLALVLGFSGSFVKCPDTHQ
jgi:hypothetical protein